MVEELKKLAALILECGNWLNGHFPNWLFYLKRKKKVA